MKERVQRTKLRDRAAEEILDMVISSGLRPGERLPPERELCERLGVSRTVVKEALNLVEARGLISIEHGRGAVVSGGEPRAVRGTLWLLLRVQPKTLWELLEMRGILEVGVAGLAARGDRGDAGTGGEDARLHRGARGLRRRRRGVPRAAGPRGAQRGAARARTDTRLRGVRRRGGGAARDARASVEHREGHRGGHPGRDARNQGKENSV